ncbi:MAG: TIGR03435 family protein, partial [Acidobacteriota bacterium]
YDLRRATLPDLIGIAWGVDPGKVVEGPAWLGFDRFDISAKAPPSSPRETVTLMLQSLLADRFRLALHKDTRPLPTFALTRGKGPLKLKEADGSGSPGCQARPGAGAASDSTFSCRNITMGALAAALRRMAGDYLPEPVVDSTGVGGSWDFDIRWNPRSRVLQAGADRTTIFDALDKQLGLKLELQQVPTPVIVVDRVNQKPTANPPGVAQALPLRSLEFEVAAVKPSAPDERFGYRRYPGGRLEMRAFPMKMLISTAWDVDWDHMDERIAGAPKWVDTKRFDIIAKTSAAPDTPPGAGFLDEDFQLMLRALLTDRFRISMHFEDRPVPAWALTAVRPKLRKAEPANRSNCREARVIAQDPRDLNPRLSRLIQCQNMTMAQFAQQLQSLDRVEATFNDVVDETGLKGAYDFTISFSPHSLLQSGGEGDAARQATGGMPAASDPNGAISFTEAVSKQLGLKLTTRKRPMPVLVIDHIEEIPTDN